MSVQNQQSNSPLDPKWILDTLRSSFYYTILQATILEWLYKTGKDKLLSLGHTFKSMSEFSFNIVCRFIVVQCYTSQFQLIFFGLSLNNSKQCVLCNIFCFYAGAWLWLSFGANIEDWLENKHSRDIVLDAFSLSSAMLKSTLTSILLNLHS